MRQQKPNWIMMLLALMVAAACADGPTTPNGIEGAERHTYMLDPVTVVGHPQDPECDP
jgi:hypothetical protein